MSAEGMPRTGISLLGRLLKALTLLVARFPVTVIVVSALVAALSLTAAQLCLGFRTSRSDLLNPKSENNRRWNEFVQEFGEQEDVLVVATAQDARHVPPILDELAAAVQRQPNLFRSVFYKVDPSKLRAKGLYQDQASLQNLRQIDGFLAQAQSQGVLRGEPDLASFNIGGQVAWFAQQLDASDPRQLAASMSGSQEQQARSLGILAAALQHNGNYVSPLPEMPGLSAAAVDVAGSGYTLLNDGHVGLLTLRLEKKGNSTNFAEYAKGLEELRRIVADAKSRHPEAWVGLTGIPVMENDEMESSQTAMAQAGILSFLGVGLLYIAGFGCVRHPLMALIALLVPMAWSCGYILLTVGHLNILSSAFATIVIGLGSDYGVYHVAQYLRCRGEGMSLRNALVATAVDIGPGLTTSAVATAAAFYMIGSSDFPGIAELGTIAGGGLLLCWLASLTTLPALLHWTDARRPDWKVPPPLDVYRWLGPMTRRPRLVVGLYAALTVVLCFGLNNLWYDHNLLNLQADGLESVKLEKKLLESDFSSSFAVSLAKDRKELLARKAMFLDKRACPMVDSVREIGSYFPEDIEAKRPWIERIHERLAGLPQQMPAALPPIPVVPPAQLGQALARLQGVMAAMQKTPEAAQLQQLCVAVRSMPEQEYYRRMSDFQNRLAADMLQRLYALREVSNPEPPSHADLPEGLVSRFIGKTGCYCLQIHTKADIWNMDEMQEFIRELRGIDPAVTGNPVQVYESSREMKLGYERGALYGVILVVFVVWLDFRNVRMTLLALLPLVISKVQLFGLMGLLGIPLNPANMIVLPLILGIGVDTGIQIVHDYMREPFPYRMNPSTSAAIMINTLMNIVGFGALMVAAHRGLHSLGRVLTLGMASCLVAGLVMPSLLQILPDLRPKEKAKAKEPSQVLDSGIDLSLETSLPRTAASAAIRRRSA